MRNRTATITVAKGICSPARDAITGALGRVGIVIHDIREYAINGEGVHFPLGPSSWRNGAVAYHATITVNQQAAVWAEYNLLRTGQFQLVSRPHDPRNLAWAAKWNGVMPKPWIERGCSAKIEQPSGRLERKRR